MVEISACVNVIPWQKYEDFLGQSNFHLSFFLLINMEKVIIHKIKSGGIKC